MKTVFKVALGMLIASTVLIVGCVALLAGGANEVSKQITTEQNSNAITLSEFRSMKIGSSRNKVESEFGPPEDKQEFQSEGFVDDEPRNSSCIYYNRRGGDIGEAFQFCFDEQKLTSKNAF